MAFDDKRFRTFKWLEDIAKCKAAYSSKFPKFPNIMCYCGSLYATDEILLVKVDYPEFEHLSDYEWSNVVSFADDGKLLETPIIESRERQFNDHRVFDRFFDEEFSALDCSIAVSVLKNGLRGFEINKVNPIVYTSENKLFLLGHNKDVSIKAVMMGTR